MKKIPHILLALYLILFVATAFNPYDRAVWRAESLPIMIVVLLLVFTYKKFTFSNTAYILMSLWICMHTIGAYYTFERVPFDWFNNLFGFERNMYDRVAHYVIGFYAYPLAEYVTRKKLVNVSWITYALAIFAIFTLASVYEIIERQYAVQA
jgi:putative membrane protein